jgi:hypothetical protein
LGVVISRSLEGEIDTATARFTADHLNGVVPRWIHDKSCAELLRKR